MIHFSNRVVLSLVAVALMLAPLASAQAQQNAKPAVVISIASVDEHMADLDYLMRAAGQADAIPLVTLMAGAYADGLDRKKPMGAVVTSSGMEPQFLAFVPVVMGIGGNIGSQTSTIAVRGLATGRLGRREGRIRPFLAQQLRVGGVLGLICAALFGALAYVFETSPSYALVVGAALFLVILVSSFIGAAAPIFFERMEIDPAVAASPLVTTTVDFTGILIYFGLALAMIDWLVK